MSYFRSIHGLASNPGNSNRISRRSAFSRIQVTAAAAFIISTAAVALPTVDDQACAADTGNLIEVGGKIVYGDESLMNPKEHGTSSSPVQEELRYGVSNKLADKICNFNRHFAEFSGSFLKTPFEDEILAAAKNNQKVTFYDSVTGKPLFQAPIGRTAEEFLEESEYHGWPSFRDEEVVWGNVRVLKGSGETVSVDGTHLGHNLPDRRGNRYCINLVSIAGNPVA